MKSEEEIQKELNKTLDALQIHLARENWEYVHKGIEKIKTLEWVLED